MKMRPRVTAGSATSAKCSDGRHSTITSAASASAARPSSGGGWRKPAMALRALASSRTDTATSARPGTSPASTRRATARPMAPNPAIASFTGPVRASIFDLLLPEIERRALPLVLTLSKEDVHALPWFDKLTRMEM